MKVLPILALLSLKSRVSSIDSLTIKTKAPRNLNKAIIGAKKEAKVHPKYVPGDKEKVNFATSRKKFQRVHRKEIKTQTEIGFCNKNFIQAIGLRGSDARYKVLQATNDERRFCIKNELTCCEGAAYRSYRKFFTKNFKVMAESFESIQELLSLFRGPIHTKLLSELKEDQKCHFVVQKMNLLEKPEDFFSDEELERNLENVGKQWAQFDSFVSNIKNFYTNFICSMCNPLESKFFWSENGHFYLKVNMEVLEDRIESFKFEIGLMQNFERFIYPLAKMVQCHFNIEHDPRFYLQSFNFFKSKFHEKKLEACLNDFSPSNSVCQSLMQISLYRHKFHTNFGVPIKQALSLLYFGIAEKHIETFYNDIKGVEWNDDQDYIYEFFPKDNKKFRRFGLKKPIFVVADEGASISRNPMAKEFWEEAASAFKKGVGIALVLVFGIAF